MSIDLRQLNQSELSGFVSGMLSGNANAIIAAYVANGSPDFGSTVLYVSGLAQTVSGQKSFVLSPTIPYSGTTGQAVSMQYVIDQLANFQLQGIQTFSGGTATSFFYVPSPVSGLSAINLNYLNSIGIVYNTGDQTISGAKTFTGNIYVPTATSGWQAIPYNQFNTAWAGLDTRITALEAGGESASGFAGVLSFNAQSGNIFTQGLGSVTVTQVGNVIKISGSSTGNLSGVQGPMGPFLHYRGSWATGIVYSYLDWVNDANNVSWGALTGHLSNAGNMPAPSNPYWGLLASGSPGPSGAQGTPSILFNWRGQFNPTTTYNTNDAVFQSGSAYGYLGSSGITGVNNGPVYNTGWSLVVNSQPIDTGAFYPISGNPSSFVVDTGQLIHRSETGQFSWSGHSHPYVLSLKGLIGNVDVVGAGGTTISTGGGQLIINSVGGGGSSGNLNYRGTWSSLNMYASGDGVTLNNSVFFYTGATPVLGISNNPLMVPSEWIQFNGREITFNTGEYNPLKIYYSNDLARLTDDSGVTTQYINTNCNSLLSLHPSGYYNQFSDCDDTPGYNLLVLTTATKNPYHPYYGLGNASAYLINDIAPNYNASGYGALTLIRGNSYYFDQEPTGVPFILTTDISGNGYAGQVTGNVRTGSRLEYGGGSYIQMVSGTAMGSGTMLFQPDSNTPSTLYYQCATQPYMGYKISVIDANPWQVFVSGGIGAQGPAGTQGYPGLAFNWRGNYDNTAFYNANDAVYYQGSSWGVNTNVSAVAPSLSSLVWFPLALSGQAGSSGSVGPAGLTFIWEGNWSSSGNYLPNQAVYYNGTSYATTGANSGKVPTSFPNIWFTIAQSGAAGPSGAGAPGLAFVWRGDWNSLTNYNSGDSVYFEGSSYATNATASGIIPPASPWQVIARKGGSIFSWQGEYNSGTQYYGGDAVYYDGSSYGTLARVSGENPDSSMSWFIVAEKGADGSTGPIGPSGVTTNLWKGAWNSTVNYLSGYLTSYNGSTYVASGTVSGTPPPNSPWQVFASGGAPVFLFNWQNGYNATTEYSSYDSVYYLGSSWATTISGLSGVAPAGTGEGWFVVAQGTSSGAPYVENFYQQSLVTGFALGEKFLPYNLIITGLKAGCPNSGHSPISGRVYFEDDTLNRPSITNFVVPSGTGFVYTSILGFEGNPGTGFISNKFRVGYDISGNFTSVTRFTLGIFGQMYSS